VKSAAKILSVDHRRKLEDSLCRGAVIPYLRVLLGGLPEHQEKANRGQPVEERDDPPVLPWEAEPNYDDLESCGNNYEFDLEPLWI
jgi:hypothetical protein